jgi:hypothetical protein
MRRRRDGLRKRVANLRSSSIDITPAAREKKRKLHATYREAWLKRKRLCGEAVENIADAMERKPKDLQTLVGIETDEAACAVCPPPQGAKLHGLQPPEVKPAASAIKALGAKKAAR